MICQKDKKFEDQNRGKLYAIPSARGNQKSAIGNDQGNGSGMEIVRELLRLLKVVKNVER